MIYYIPYQLLGLRLKYTYYINRNIEYSTTNIIFIIYKPTYIYAQIYTNIIDFIILLYKHRYLPIYIIYCKIKNILQTSMLMYT